MLLFSRWVLSDSFVTPGSSVHGQDYWSKLLFPIPGDLPHPEIKLTPLHLLHFSQILYHGVTLANTLEFGEIWNLLPCVCVLAAQSNYLQPRGLQSSRLLCPWNSPGKNPGVGCHFLFQKITIREWNSGLPHCRQIFLLPEPPGKPLVIIQLMLM